MTKHITIDVDKKFGVSKDGIDKAVDYARCIFVTFPMFSINCICDPRNIFLHSPNTFLTLYISAGVHKITFSYTSDTLDLSNIKPGINTVDIYVELIFLNSGPDGRLVIKGAGSDKTVLVTDNFHNTMSGSNINRLTISDIHFTRNQVILLNIYIQLLINICRLLHLKEKLQQ